jgi:phage shock protein E
VQPAPHVRRSAARRSGVALLAVAALLLGACSGAGGPSASAAPADAEVSPRTLGADDAVDLLAARDDVVVLDVRTPAEVAEGALAGAQVVDAQAPGFRADLDALDRDETYLLYCRSGNRSAAAAALMDDLGFTDVLDAGAFVDLAAAGAPTVG